MKVKVFDKNEKGKIEFTRKELEALLNEVFNDGYQEGKDSKTYTWTSPTWTYLNSSKNYEPYYKTDVTCNNIGTTDSNFNDFMSISYGLLN